MHVYFRRLGKDHNEIFMTFNNLAELKIYIDKLQLLSNYALFFEQPTATRHWPTVPPRIDGFHQQEYVALVERFRYVH